jgi:hypothetical protein
MAGWTSLQVGCARLALFEQPALGHCPSRQESAIPRARRSEQRNAALERESGREARH